MKKLLSLILLALFLVGGVASTHASGLAISVAVGDRPYYHGRVYRHSSHRYNWVPGHWVHRRHHRRVWIHGHYNRY